MKPLNPWLAAAFAASLGTPATGAAPPGTPRQIQTRVVWYEVDTASSRKILSTPGQSGDDSDVLKLVEELVAVKKARVVDAMMATCRAGETSRSEGSKTMSFPASFIPPSLPGGGQSGPANPPHPIPRAEQSAVSGLTIDAAEIREETGFIRLSLTTRTASHSGEKTWFEWRTPRGNADVRMPIFTDLSCRLNLTLAPGVPMMAAALTPIGADHKPVRNRKLLVFVTATAGKTTEK